MLVYYLLQKKEIVNIMSSKIVELNITNGILYTKMPQLSPEIFALRFYLRENEKEDLIKLKASVYSLNRGIHLEGRRFKIILNDEEQLEYLKQTNLLYKEIKFTNEDNKNICLKYLKENNNNYILAHNKETLLQQYELKKNIRVNKIKGMIYGITSEAGMLKDYILDNFSIYYQELTGITIMMERLRNKKMLDNSLFINFKNLKRNLEKKVIRSVNDLDKKELIFKFNEKRNIEFSNDFLALAPLEKQLFEVIINKIINNVENASEKEMLANIIIQIDKVINNNAEYNEFSNDIKLILDRVYEKNYDTNINNIKSILFKNIYAVYIKYNNLRELYTFLNEKHIPRKYISMSLYGASKGFTYMPNSSTLNLQRDIWAYEVIKSSLINVENNFYDTKYNNNYTKSKIYYFLNEISFYVNKTKNCNLLYTDIVIENIKNYVQMTIRSKDYGEMVINFYPRTKNMAKSIKYFDNKIERLKEIYVNLNYNDSIYFYYYFIKNKKIKMNILQKEYYFSVLLKEISNVIKLKE